MALTECSLDNVNQLSRVLRGKTVVFIADVPTQGGATNSLLELSSTLQMQYGMRCIVLTAQSSGFNKRLDSLKVENYVTGHRAFLVPKPQCRWKMVPKIIIFGIGWLLHYGHSIKNAESQIDFEKVDIIHSNLPRNDIGEALARKYSKPHICHLREFSFKDFNCMSFRRNPAKFISDNSTAMIAISKAVADEWMRLGVEKDKVHVIYNGVDVDWIGANQAKDDEKTGGEERGKCFRAVFLGGYSETKGIDDVLEAMKALKRAGESIALDIYGGSTDKTRKKYNKHIRDNGLSGIVAFHGYDAGISDKLSKYDVALVCSKCEAFGRVVIECNAAGVPVIGRAAGALPELIVEGETGLLYGNGHGSLDEKIIEIKKDAATLKSMRSKAQAHARNFTKEINAFNIASLYAEILDAE